MKQTHQSINGTSFYNSTFNATPADLRKLFGEPQWECNSGDDKANFIWYMETSKETVFTVYDWKEYRSLREDQTIEWHIGGNNRRDTEEALEEITETLNNIKE